MIKKPQLENPKTNLSQKKSHDNLEIKKIDLENIEIVSKERTF